MAEGTVLARIALRGDRQFRRAVENAGDQMDDAGNDAAGLSFMLGRAAGVLENVRNDAVGASGALSLLQGRADEAGDELGDVGRSGILAASGLTSAAGGATTTSGSFTTLTASTNGLALSFGSLSTSLIGMAALIGGVGAAATGLVSALVPLVATLGGLTAGATALAGAFGAVIGSGALAYGEQLADQYEEELTAVQKQIEEYEQLEDARGELTDGQRERLRQLKQEEQRLDDVEGPLSALQVRLGELGSELSTIIAEWGQQFAPLVADAIDAIPTLARNILDAVGGLDRFGDVLRSAGQRAMTLIPQIAGVMADLAREALPVLIDGMQWLLNNGAGIFQGIMQTTREVAPLLQQFGGDLAAALPDINRFGTGVLHTLVPALGDAVRGLGNLLGKFMDFTRTEQFERIMSEIRTQMTRIGPELDELVMNLDKLLQTVIENGPEIIRGVGAVADTVLDIINPLLFALRRLIDLIGAAADAWNDWVQRSEQQERNLARQGPLGWVAGGLGDNFAPQTRTATRQQQFAGQQEIRIAVEGDTEVVRDVSAEVYDRRDSQASDQIRRGGFRGE